MGNAKKTAKIWRRSCRTTFSSGKIPKVPIRVHEISSVWENLVRVHEIHKIPEKPICIHEIHNLELDEFISEENVIRLDTYYYGVTVCYYECGPLYWYFQIKTTHWRWCRHAKGEGHLPVTFSESKKDKRKVNTPKVQFNFFVGIHSPTHRIQYSWSTEMKFWQVAIQYELYSVKIPS
jgi:hypothetical protein